MRILIACEESQAVCIEMRRLGHEAYSCDLQPCSGGHPEWHLQVDALELLKMRWDMIIAHPPCTYLTVSGNRWFSVERYGDKAKERIAEREKAVCFFKAFIEADCQCVAIENPVGYMNTHHRKPDQIIQPYMFGDHARKTTCLWLKGLPKLEPTNVVDPGEILSGGYSVGASAHYARDENGKAIPWNDPRTAKIRSKTYPGIARAMAEQWAGPNAEARGE